MHLLIRYDPQFGIHRDVKHLKGFTSRILRTEYPKLTTRLPSLWTNAYFIATVGTVTFRYRLYRNKEQREKIHFTLEGYRCFTIGF